MMPLPPLGDLELLARHAPTIYGRALDPDKPTLTPMPSNGRPDWVDGKSGAGGELGRAKAALEALLALSSEGPEGRRVALTMWIMYGHTGLAIRGTGLPKSGYVLVSEVCGTLPPPPPEPPSPPQRSGKRPPSKEQREADDRAKAAYGAWERARKARVAEGEKLYDRAETAWLARVVRRTG
jgi:hypothetical protein